MAEEMSRSKGVWSSARQRVSLWLGRDKAKSNDHDQHNSSSRISQSLSKKLGLSSECPSQSQSRFFSRLPPEIRHEILVYAFGDRTMHVDLSTEHPLVRKRRSILVDSSRNPKPSPFIYVMNKEKARQKSWRSSACPCNGPRTPPAHIWWHEHWHEPEVDAGLVRDGDTSACESWTGMWPLRHFVGALGWLLTCRQAYEEGVDVLYRTNTFHIGGKHLMSNLLDHIPPRHLNQVPSIEVSLPLSEMLDVHGNGLQPSHSAFAPLLQNLGDLHSLRRLHLGLPCPRLWADEEEIKAAYANHVVEMMDGFVRSHGDRLQSVVVQIEPRGVEAMRSRLGMPETVEGEAADNAAFETWRCLDSDDTKNASGTLGDRSKDYGLIPAGTSALSSPKTIRGYTIVSFTKEEKDFITSIWLR